MESKLSNINDTTKELAFTFAKAELEPIYNEAYKKAQPELELPGFRKGRVPLNMVKQQFGPRIQADADMDLLNEKYEAYLKGEEIVPVSAPELIDIRKDADNVTFVLHFEVTPEFELKDIKGIKVNEPVHVVNDEEVDKEIDMMAKKMGTPEVAEQATDLEYIVDLEISKLDQETKLPIIGGEKNKFSVYLADEQILPSLRNSLNNCKVGDTFTFNPSADDPQGDPSTFNVEVMAIKKLVPHELNEEFATTVSNGKVSSMEQLRDDIHFQLQGMWDKRSKELVEDQLVKAVVELHKEVAVPNALVNRFTQVLWEDVKRQHKQITEENPPKEFVENAKERATFLARWSMINDKIISTEKIDVDKFEIEEHVADQIKDWALEEEQRDMFMKQLVKNEQVKNEILLKKVIDLLYGYAETNEVTFEGGKFTSPLDEEHDHVHGEDCDCGHDH